MLITDTPVAPFYKISIDTVGPLPVTPNGNKHILTVQDNLTKYCIAVPIPNTQAETIADALARKVIAQFGSPRVILSDKAKALTGNVIQCLATIFKIKTMTTSGYRPESNGSLERTHLGLIEYLRQFTETQDDWDKVVDFAMFSYNTSIHESTGFTPFELIFGHKARTPSSLPLDQVDTYPSYLTELVLRLQDTRLIAAEKLVESKHRTKNYYDQKAKPQSYHKNDQVYALKEPKRAKLDKPYSGGYTITDIIGDKNVILRDDKGRKFLKHIDKIKPSYQRNSLSFSDVKNQSQYESDDTDSCSTTSSSSFRG